MSAAMSRGSAQRTTFTRRFGPSLALFLLGLVLSLFAASWQGDRNRQLAASRFEGLSQHVIELLSDRLAVYENGLRGARGAFLAAGGDGIDRRHFEEYSQSRDNDLEFPGARGIGIIRRVSAADEAHFLSVARSDRTPNFAIRELAPHTGDHYVIQYIEPAERNLPAIGLDVASEPRRFRAAQDSMHSGRATLTAPIAIVQASQRGHSAFLLLLPIYAPNEARTTPEQRQLALVGWSYAPLVMEEVLAPLGIGEDLTLALRDSEEPENQFFLAPKPGADSATGIVRRVQLPVYERTWQIEFRSTLAFLNGLHLLDPRAVSLGGVGTSALLSFLLYLFAQNVQRKSQVREEQASRSAIVESTSDAIIVETLDGVITDWNPAAERLFGYLARFAIGRTAADLLLPDERMAEYAEIRDRARRGEATPAFDTRCRRADCALIDVSVTASPILDSRGQCIACCLAVRDISERKRVEQEIHSLNASLELQVGERTRLLDRARRDLQNILDAVPSLISYWDRDLCNRFANRAYANWFGWDAESMVGRSLRDLYGERSEENRECREAALRGEARSVERTFPRADGPGVRHVSVHYLPDFDGEQVGGFYVFAHDITAQTEANERLAAALRDTEALLSAIHEHAIVSVTDRAGTIVDLNQRFCAISGYSRQELLGKNHRIVNSGELPASFWQSMWATIAAGKAWRGEICNRAKDGSLYWVDSMIAPFKGADGQIEKFIAIRFDITEKKRMEAELQQSHERIAIAADTAEIGVWELDVAKQSLVWDERMYGFYGRRPGDAVHPYALWATSLHPDDREGAEGRLSAALRGEASFDSDFRIVRPDGEVRHLKAAARVVRDESGTPLRMLGVNFDITERRRAEIELLETSSLLRGVLEAASEVSIIATDPDLLIQVFNAGAEHLLGYTAREIVNRATPLLIHDPAEVEARAVELTAQGGEPVASGGVFIHPLALRQAREWTYIRKDGGRVTVSLVVTQMRTESGEVFGYLGVAHDITQQKSYERSLRLATQKAEQASSAKSEFLANMSHEIRTPMNAIIGLSSLLGQTALSVEQRSFLGKITASGGTLLSLINDILDVSKIEAGELQVERAPFNLLEVLQRVQDVALLQTSAKRIGFERSVSDVPTQLEGDATRLGQILTNLLSNAVKFTAHGGVTLRVRQRSSSANSVVLCFEVEDTGIGIPVDVQERVFSPFVQADTSTTRRFGGTGLGLSIVKRLAELMAGEVTLRSVAGQGSTFSVTLPFDLAPQAERAPELPLDTAKRERALTGKQVLVVDDADMNLYVARHVLERAGVRVTTASNGQVAIDLLTAMPERFDAVLMDVQMPGMDGYEATRTIRDQLGLSRLPVIALTADARSTERTRSQLAGMNDFVSKPFEVDALLACLRRQIFPEGGPPISVPSESRGAPASAPSSWPQVEGIDSDEARANFDGDANLFRTLLALFLGDNAQLAVPIELCDPNALAVGRALAHKLRGGASQLGARKLAKLAAECEDACRAGDVSRAPLVMTEISAEFRRLRQAAHDLSGVAAPPAPGAGAEALAGGELARVVTLLRQQDLSALAQIQAAAPGLRSLLGEGSPGFFGCIEQLRFQDAVRILEQRVGRS